MLDIYWSASPPQTCTSVETTTIAPTTTLYCHADESGQSGNASLDFGCLKGPTIKWWSRLQGEGCPWKTTSKFKSPCYTQVLLHNTSVYYRLCVHHWSCKYNQITELICWLKLDQDGIVIEHGAW